MSQQQHFLLSVGEHVSARRAEPRGDFHLVFCLFHLGSAKRVQIVSPPHREGSRDFPAALAVLTPASGLQKSIYSHKQEEDE